MRRPLGISILGGLLVSQLLTLYTTPVVYLYLDRFRLWSKRPVAADLPRAAWLDAGADRMNTNMKSPMTTNSAAGENGIGDNGIDGKRVAGVSTGLTLVACGLTLVLGGCAVGPDYKKPELAVPAAYKENAGWQQAAPADAIKRGAWWEIFGDPILNDLEKQIEVSNQSLRQAEAQYRESAALVSSARSSLWPTVSASLSATRSGRYGNSGGGIVSGGTVISGSGETGNPGSSHPANSYSAAAVGDVGTRSLGRHPPSGRRERVERAGERGDARIDAAVAARAARDDVLPAAHRRRTETPARRHGRRIRAGAQADPESVQRRSRRARRRDPGRDAAQERAGAGDRPRPRAYAIRTRDRGPDRQDAGGFLVARAEADPGAASDSGRHAGDVARAPPRRGRRRAAGRGGERADRRRQSGLVSDAHPVGERRLPEFGMVAAARGAESLLVGRATACRNPVRRRRAARAVGRGGRGLRRRGGELSPDIALRVPERRGSTRRVAHPRKGSRRAGRSRQVGRTRARDRDQPVPSRAP